MYGGSAPCLSGVRRMPRSPLRAGWIRRVPFRFRRSRGSRPGRGWCSGATAPAGPYRTWNPSMIRLVDRHEPPELIAVGLGLRGHLDLFAMAAKRSDIACTTCATAPRRCRTRPGQASRTSKSCSVIRASWSPRTRTPASCHRSSDAWPTTAQLVLAAASRTCKKIKATARRNRPPTATPTGAPTPTRPGESAKPRVSALRKNQQAEGGRTQSGSPRAPHRPNRTRRPNRHR
jgi:hypothetical protein